MEGNFRGIFPTGVENWFEFAGVSNNRGFQKSGVKLNYSVTVKQIQGKRRTGSSYREVRETEGNSRNRYSTIGLNCLMLVLH